MNNFGQYKWTIGLYNQMKQNYLFPLSWWWLSAIVYSAQCPYRPQSMDPLERQEHFYGSRLLSHLGFSFWLQHSLCICDQGQAEVFCFFVVSDRVVGQVQVLDSRQDPRLLVVHHLLYTVDGNRDPPACPHALVDICIRT